MFDRNRYASKYAPSADELEANWKAKTPSSREIESFFLKELCESSEHEYFLAVSDLFLQAVQRQEKPEQIESLCHLTGRLLDAAEMARGVRDAELVAHFDETMGGFLELYAEHADLNRAREDKTIKAICSAEMVVRSIVMKDLTLARMIIAPYHELVCTNRQCERYEQHFQCPGCEAYAIPEVYYRRFHNSRHIEGHPQ